MNTARRRRKRKPVVNATALNEEDGFILATCGEYLIRHIGKRHFLDRESIEFLLWIMGDKMELIVDLFQKAQPVSIRSRFAEAIEGAEDDAGMLADVLLDMLKKTRPHIARKTCKSLVVQLELAVEKLRASRKTNIESNFESLRELFSFDQAELKLAVFLFIVKTYDEAETFFIDHLKCDKFRGRNHLLNLLGIRNQELSAALDRFDQIDITESCYGEFELTEWFLNRCLTPESESISSKFFKSIPEHNLPISLHMVGQDKIHYVRKLLEKKRGLPVHILLYGPPGTGKTSFAYAVASGLKDPVYEIVGEEENTSKHRRAALTACLKMANSGKGAIVIIDEADNILNTIGSWFLRGETQDKGWLNKILEEPGTRFIWITNSIDSVDNSVLRRFTFSLHFKPFNRRQRIGLWGNILRQNKAASFLDSGQVERLARKYRLSAGEIDTSVKAALAAISSSKGSFTSTLELSLEAYCILKYKRNGRSLQESVEENCSYSLDGLNIEGYMDALIGQMARFDQTLRSDPGKRINFNLLFYGPPGTGKSALARHIANRLDREIICRRYSDLQSMYVGQGEKNIREAFEEAENEEAVLVVDEADSMLFGRDRAQRSWEISFTNEFLTSMEYYRGILICTTNRMDELDEASIRRFNSKIKFNFLTPEGNVVFYRKMLAGLISTPIENESMAALKRIPNLAPGDFKNVRDRYALHSSESLNHKILVDALAEESRIKDLHAHVRSIGF
jgi:transitional endoplasmic reticulum ATPase